MMPEWYRKAVKAGAWVGFHPEQLTTPSSQRHGKPAPASAIEHTLFATVEKTGNLGHRHVPFRQIAVGTVAPKSLDHFIETSPLLGQSSLHHTHVHAELFGNQGQTATLYRHHAQDRALDLIDDIRCRLQVELSEILLQCVMQIGGLLLAQ